MKKLRTAFSYIAGVPQCTVLVPFSFHHHMIDLEPKTSEINQYVDNTVRVTSHCDLDCCYKSLEHSKEVLLEYTTSLPLKLNADKTEFI